MKESEVLNAIKGGDLDLSLSQIAKAVISRKDYVLRRRVSSFMLGQRVMLVEDGRTGEVVKVNVKTIGVSFDLDDPSWVGHTILGPGEIEPITNDD